jgi:hypothetical protein
MSIFNNVLYANILNLNPLYFLFKDGLIKPVIIIGHGGHSFQACLVWIHTQSNITQNRTCHLDVESSLSIDIYNKQLLRQAKHHWRG